MKRIGQQPLRQRKAHGPWQSGRGPLGRLRYLGASGTPRAEGGRTSWAHTLDAHVGTGYWLGRQSRVEFSLDVFNILDVQEDVRWEGGTPLLLQAPRQLRLGARYLFL